MSSGADVLAQVESRLEGIANLSAEEVNGGRERIHAEANRALAEIRAFRHWKRVTPALLFPTPTAGTSPEHEEGA